MSYGEGPQRHIKLVQKAPDTITMAAVAASPWRRHGADAIHCEARHERALMMGRIRRGSEQEPELHTGRCTARRMGCRFRVTAAL